MGEKRRKIYPGYGRINFYSDTYAHISINNYCRAKELYNDIIKADYKMCNLDPTIHSTFYNHVIISVVFSAMAIEAFVNDYAASCMGDELFYQNFDHLSIISKLQLIAEFILKRKFDKTKSYYSNVKEIFSARDKFVHSKSQSADDYFNKNNITFPDNFEEYVSHFDAENYLVAEKDELNKEFCLSQTAIKAMRDIAKYFDNIDSNCYAFFRLLGIGEFSKEENDYKTIISDFSIKIH